MRITLDTNVLVRAVVQDDKKQARTAAKLLKDAELIAIPTPCLCEFVWVLRRVYDLPPADIAGAVQAILETRNVQLNRPAVEAGLGILASGGDFADGAIAFEGTWLGGETFVSFDRKAVAKLSKQGQSAKLLV